MNKMSNKVVALTTIGLWLLVALIAFVNGFMYGFPPVGSVLPDFVVVTIGWASFGMTIYAFYRLFKAPDSPAGI